MISLDKYTIGLQTFELFEKMILPEYEKKQGWKFNTEEKVNLFLDLRKEHNIHGEPNPEHD